MDNFYFALKLATIAIGFVFGAICLYIYWRTRQERSYLYFGLISVSAGLAFLTYRESYFLHLLSWLAKLPLFFNFCSWVILPWFVYSFTGYGRRGLRILISAGLVLIFAAGLLVGRDGDNMLPYLIPTHLFYLINLVYLLLSGIYIRRMGDRRKGMVMLSTALAMFLLFAHAIAINYSGESYRRNFYSHYYPTSFFPLFFMIIMGTEMTNAMMQKFLLETNIQRHKRNWSSLLNNINLLAFITTETGLIIEANRFFLETTRYEPSAIINADDGFGKLFRRPGEQHKFRDFVGAPDNGKMIQNCLTDASLNEKVVIWMKIYLEDGSRERKILCIGHDQTDLIRTNNDLKKLFSELELTRSRMVEENIAIDDLVGTTEPQGQIIGGSPAIRYVMMRVQQVARSNTSILLEGETGVGKEVIAKYIHSESSRSQHPMITVNCAAIPAQLLESELFGHEKGAFTGADRQKKGRFELAGGSTLFLDEIGELPLELQPKLLRVLQESEIERLGGNSPIKVDVRIIAATNRSLRKDAEQGRFRPDLFYRLNIFPITIPPLRQRKQDIPLLVNAFIRKFSEKHGKQITQIPPTVMDHLIEYEWPGNIRELQNIIEQSVITARGEIFRLSKLSTRDMKDGVAKVNPENEKLLTLEESERLHILRALQMTSWKVSGEEGAAHLLGINPSTLRSRMVKLGITRADA